MAQKGNDINNFDHPRSKACTIMKSKVRTKLLTIIKLKLNNYTHDDS